MRGRAVWLTGLFAGLLLISACVAGIVTSVQYKPKTAGTQPPSKNVVLKVIDDREPKVGGREKNLVGQARGGYGNPFGVRESGPQNVANLIKAATSDALLQAGVATREASERTLVATVKKYWADGYATYTATVEVHCALQASDGKVLWESSIRGQQLGGLGFSPKTNLTVLYTNAVEEYAKKAAEQFKSAEFQGQVP